MPQAIISVAAIITARVRIPPMVQTSGFLGVTVKVAMLASSRSERSVEAKGRYRLGHLPFVFFVPLW